MLKTVIKKYSPLLLTFALVGNACADWKDVLNSATGGSPMPGNQTSQSLHNIGQALQKGQQTINTAQTVQPGSLTDLLMKQTGVTQTQALGGAGALFQAAKNKMQADSFARLEQSVPGIQEMLSAAPAIQQSSPLDGLPGKLSSITGVSGETVGSLVSVASAFQQQGLSPGMVQQFVPVVVEYVRTTGGEALANTLSAALIGR
ncbi:MAG: DUF2780 domain-containing protein [Methylobacter sp.]